ncbi:redoxin domain-containing protein [Mucilaginibacter rubeus]|uniref:Redoxin domain-containing protein n=1 Tax=Mucilaginibacter rubeus TaxID=2027860 RepID=A0AAE6MLI8_9SPHI|nr:MULTISPECIES: redoxin family protein [Mucilaginibacter]QEM07806.1 redoxin domain-containing protein [Mucilaginibacter rubeus]QEM20258.1 redoxin domain-containing protein [Mucilaginibacter gossypii]QTE43024.1 redoxin family protein [Mucilaginibacter rubeus]QTE49625.1 redoxin family protein [Mucilaginibacter rubeus]QTE54720.1 redoxin family protein [Mucilaginibacter rubeus]
MKKTILIIVLAALCQNFRALASVTHHNNYAPDLPDTLSKPVTVGQAITGNTWSAPLKILQSNKESVQSLEKYQGKVIILDFWATWCGSCIEHIPELNSLQVKYKNDLAVILVNSYNTGDTKEKVVRLLKSQNSEIKNGLSLPCIIGDTLLAKTFPHTFLPHLIWIGKDGIVKAITSAEEVTTKNIDLLLSTNGISTYGKTDEAPEKLLYTDENLPLNNLIEYSILLKGKIDGVGGGSRPRKINDTVRGMVFSNRSLFTMYGMAADRLIKNFTPKNIILEVADSSVFFKPHSTSLKEWQRTNFYSLDIIVPPGRFANFYEYMLQDLNRYSGYVGTIETRELSCWVLQRTNQRDLFSTKSNSYMNTLFETNNRQLKNAPLRDLCEWLNSLTPSNQPVIDETGYTGMIDIQFDNNSTKLDGVNDQLAAQGLRLTFTKLPQVVLVIKKNTLSKESK